MLPGVFDVTFDSQLEDYDANVTAAHMFDGNQHSPHNPKNSQFLRVAPEED